MSNEPSPQAPPVTQAMSRRKVVATAAAATAAAGVVALDPGRALAKVASNSARGKAAVNTSATLPDATAILAEGRDLVDHEVVEFAALLRAGVTTSVEITEAYLERIHEFNGPFETYGDNGGYNAFVRIDEEGALQAAREADAKIAAGRAGGEEAHWLCGIPFGIKDSVGIKGLAAQDGTVDFYGNVAEEDALAVSYLRNAGVVLVGSTICSAYSSSIIGGFAGNAWDMTRMCGGSSQGSGVAPVARLIAGTLGEETGGSIQFPSSANGATGIKPSTGVVPVAGLMPLTPGVDVLGPIMKSARDAALVLNTIANWDARDPQTFQVPRPFAVPLEPREGSRPLARTTIGIPLQDWTTKSSTAVPQTTYQEGFQAVFARVRTELEQLGATVKEFTWPNYHTVNNDPYYASETAVGKLKTAAGTEVGVSASTALAYANRAEFRYIEAVQKFAESRSPRQFESLQSQFTSTANPTFAAMASYYRQVTAGMRNEAEARRRQLVWHCMKAMKEAEVDFMMVMNTPSVPTTTTIPIYRAAYQLPNQLGWPMINFPAGAVTKTGTESKSAAIPGETMPASVAFWGPRFSEPEIVQAAIDYQAAHPQWHTARPADPWGGEAPATAGARTLSKRPSRRVSEGDWEQIEENLKDPTYSTDITVSKGAQQ